MSVSAILTLGNTTAVMVLGEEVGVPILLVQGQTGPLWNLTFKNADNTALNLTGQTSYAFVLFDRQAPASVNGLALTGTMATVVAASGTATFAPAAADVAIPGEFDLEVKLTISALLYFFRAPLTILPRYMA